MRAVPALRALLIGAAVAAVAASPAAAIQVTPIPLPGNGTRTPLGISAGPDGRMWFVEKDSSRFGVVAQDGTLTDFSTGSGISANSEPWAIAAGPDGGVWFSEQLGNRIGRIDPATRAAVEFSTGLSPNAAPRGITGGPDGAVWFAEDSGRIGRIAPNGAITEFSQGITPGSRPLDIVTGADGNLWFTELFGGIGRITPQGAVTEFRTGLPANALPEGIVAGSDGNLWFTMGVRGIGRITTAGVITAFPLPAGVQARGITAGPDGALWFTDEDLTPGVGRITTAGVPTLFPVARAEVGSPIEIDAGPTRELWATSSSELILRIRPDPAAVTGGAVPAPGGGSVSGTVDPFASPTTWTVQFGPTAAYGSATAPRAVAPGPGPVAVGAVLAGLPPATTIHYRVVATSAAGSSAGADRTFTTPAGAGGGGGGGSPLDRTGPRVRIAAARLVPAGGRVRVRVTCPLSEPLGCRGTVRLLSAARLRPDGRGRPRVVALGSAPLRLRGGQPGAVQVTLTRAARPLLRRGPLRARVAVSARDAAGNTGRTSRVVVLGPARP